MGLVILDSSVLIAALNPKDAHHEAALKSNTVGVQFIISAISITELMPRAIKEGSDDSVWTALTAMVHHVVDVNSSLAMSAAQIRSTDGLKTPDAIISATARAEGAELWTFDAKLAKATPGARCLA
jgi:predicted nucleic acid-binding protein